MQIRERNEEERRRKEELRMMRQREEDMRMQANLAMKEATKQAIEQQN
jgi:hypothetical protein